ncbi:hypothetical protein [Larkinella rosea]|uniref:Outer membrane protein beta-barrel domain-containing protein n=1 Tax=Larkinella rosea TaxID=2025312 RepID=A0A3P1BBX1_9BACT|nr:hypothetical protein [Larkinella rosea]RRA98550.1 hypothetical protein EHT25_26455 [Larkinella rosea]
MKKLIGKTAWLWCLIAIPVYAQKTAFKPVFTNMTEFGVLLGQVRYNVTNISENVSKRQNITAQTFNGVQLRPKLALGATVGVDWYNSALLMPVCAGVRYDLAQPGKKNLRVFTSLDTGYGFTWLNEDPTGYETRGGWVIAPGIGFRIGRPQNANFILSLSYKRQEAEADKPLAWNEIYKIENRVYNRLAFRLGLSF